MMDTPILSHITQSDYTTVYEPAEDSYLMLDALEKEIEVIKELDPAVCLEVGSGSGINITAFSKVFDTCFCFCVDINRRACEVSLATSKNNDTLVECVNADLMRNIKDNSVDIIIFNPPYVVTESLEIKKSKISRAWAGGVRGREVIDKFLEMVPRVLSEKGVCYMLVIDENRPEEIAKIMTGLSFSTITVVKRKAWNEKLKVLKFSRSKDEA